MDQRQFQDLIDGLCTEIKLPVEPLGGPRFTLQIGEDALHLELLEGGDALLLWAYATEPRREPLARDALQSVLETNFLLAFSGGGSLALDRFENALIYAERVAPNGLTGAGLEMRFAQFLRELPALRQRIGDLGEGRGEAAPEDFEEETSFDPMLRV